MHYACSCTKHTLLLKIDWYFGWFKSKTLSYLASAFHSAVNNSLSVSSAQGKIYSIQKKWNSLGVTSWVFSISRHALMHIFPYKRVFLLESVESAKEAISSLLHLMIFKMCHKWTNTWIKTDNRKLHFYLDTPNFK